MTQLSLLLVSSVLIEENGLDKLTDFARKVNVENTFLVFINHAFLIWDYSDCIAILLLYNNKIAI